MNEGLGFKGVGARPVCGLPGSLEVKLGQLASTSICICICNCISKNIYAALNPWCIYMCYVYIYTPSSSAPHPLNAFTPLNNPPRTPPTYPHQTPRFCMPSNTPRLASDRDCHPATLPPFKVEGHTHGYPPRLQPPHLDESPVITTPLNSPAPSNSILLQPPAADSMQRVYDGL
jgi:hypothetical protein